MFTKNKSLSTDLSTIIPQRRSVFAIFVHFGLSETTNTAIKALLEGSITPDTVIVVDHGEIPFAPIMPVIVIRPELNTGYLGGLEAGIKKAQSLGAKEQDLCLLLNNDALVAKNSLQAVLDWWRVYGNPLVLAGSSGGYVSLLSGKAHVIPRGKRVKGWRVPYIHGSAIVGEFALFLSQRLPKTLFLYWEDVALSMELQRSGGRLAIIPGFMVIHDDMDGPVSLGKLFYLVRNGAYVLERYTSLPWRVYWYGMNTIRMAYHFQLGGMKHATVTRALQDARASRLGKADL